MFFTSESVTEGHPDKICDQISDAILDEALRQDKNTRAGIECITTTGMIFVAGEMTTKAYVPVDQVARQTLREIGYTNPEYGIDCYDCAVMNTIHEQSQNIAVGVDKTKNHEQGAGDQGCIKKGALVRTKRGFIPIEEVKIGDFVATIYGWKKVLNAQSTGIKRIIKLRFSNGMTLECTPDHKILCYQKDGVTYWKEAQALTEEDYICMLKPQENLISKYQVSFVPKKQFFSKHNHKIYGPENISLDYDIGYTTGALIGDGAVGKRHHMEIAYGKEKQHAMAVQERISHQMPDQWRLLSNGDYYSLKIDSILVRKHFENFGLLYEKAPKKRTPSAIFSSPPGVIRNYLRGLFDTDGTIVSNTGRKERNIRIRLSSSSFRLLQETQLLLNDFGIKSTILLNRPSGIKVGRKGRFGKIYHSHHDNFVLNLVGFDNYQRFAYEIGFFDKKKQERMDFYIRTVVYKPANSPGIYRIPHPTKKEFIDEDKLGIRLPFAVTTLKEKIDNEEISEVYDLQIEEVNMFSANGIYVHNSMFGFACNETPELMPLPIMMAHKLTRRLSDVRKKGILKWVRPDGKSQVTVEYGKNRRGIMVPKRIDAVVIAVHHNPNVPKKKIRSDIIETVIHPVCKKWCDKNTKIFVNETGIFTVGGPEADTGLTGRKIIVDTYGGYAPHGGGCFSGKDPSKVDRSATYMARYIAKNIVAAGLAEKCQVQLSYSIGVAQPVSVYVETFGTGILPDKELEKIVLKHFPLKPAEIIRHLNLLRPIYQKTAAYGHFGREEPEFTWERTDKVSILKKYL